MGNQGAAIYSPHEDQFDDRQFPGLHYGIQVVYHNGDQEIYLRPKTKVTLRVRLYNTTLLSR